MRRSFPRLQPTGPRAALACIVLVACAVALAACGDGERRYEVTDVRDRPEGGPPPRVGASPASRFGAEDAPSKPTWTAETPSGWSALPPAPMRELGWRVAGNPQADCTFSTLGGTGGGLAANVNRWRKQMSLPDASEADVAALPTRPWMGRDARVVELEGTFVGMGGGANVPGAKMLGLVVELPAVSAYLKMTGPAAVVDAERERFFALAASIRRGAPASSDPHAGLDMGATPPPTEAAKAPFAWKVPAEWKEQGPRTMRVATWVPEGTTKTEVFVTLLAGTGGGAIANINRWRGQVGQDDLTPEAFEKLPRAKVLGVEAVFLEVEGTYRGMAESGGDAGSMLLGMFLQRPGQAVTVKMTGPADEVRRERERFRAFCESFHE